MIRRVGSASGWSIPTNWNRPLATPSNTMRTACTTSRAARKISAAVNRSGSASTTPRPKRPNRSAIQPPIAADHGWV